MVYDINFKKVKSGRTIGVTFFIIGLFFLIIFGGFFISSITKKNSFDSQVEAYKVDWNMYDDEEDGTTYSPTYYYKVDGKDYSCSSNSSSSIKGGDGIVYYDSKNPNNCMTDFESSTNFFILAFLLIPIIFMGIGVLQIKSYLKKVKTFKALANNGVLVKGIPYTLIDSNISVNDETVQCFKITYTFPDGTTKNLVSEPAYDRVLQDYDGKCDLLYDPNNYQNYFIDLEITATGHGTPTIVQYDQNHQNANNLSYANMVSNMNNYNNNNTYNNTNNYDNNSYNPGNKF